MGTQTGAGDVTAKRYDIAFRTHAVDPPRAATWLGWAKKNGFKRMSIIAETTDYGIGLQILQDLGLSKVRLLTNNPKKADAFVIQGHGLEVVGQVPIIAPEEADRTRYLAAKRDKLGHRLPGSVPQDPEALIPHNLGATPRGAKSAPGDNTVNAR